MVKKSAAHAKVKAPLSPREERMAELQKAFDDMKKISLIIIDTQIKTAKRIDNMSNIRAYMRDFLDETPSMILIRAGVNASIEAYEAVREATEAWTLEEFMKPEIKNYFEHITPSSDDVEDDMALCFAMIKYLSVKPYGEKLVQSHHLIQEEAARLELIEEQPEE